MHKSLQSSKSYSECSIHQSRKPKTEENIERKVRQCSSANRPGGIPGEGRSRGELLRSNPSIPAATTKQLGQRKSARPTPGLELCSSAPDSRQRSEHLRHNADGLALPVNPLEKSVRILIRLILELLRIPARTEGLTEGRRGCVVAVRIIGALVKENRLRVVLVVVVVVHHGAERGVEIVPEEGIGPVVLLRTTVEDRERAQHEDRSEAHVPPSAALGLHLSQ